MPPIASCRKPLMRAMRSRICRYVTRARRRKKSMASVMGPSSRRLTSASCQLIQHMNAVMPTSFKRSRTIVMAPAANISFSTSTSVVTRETSLPTGVRSKNAMGRRCRCAKSVTRRSARLRCATSIVRYDWP
jgi:hypothetical protein